ncbi:probable chitinase 10 isoform X1 [Schistocerca cancellata]|uniref:probable chitinase 10 isoform X1 n=1 Tax=Schistocerca cancellata TaxID=274614 RepID=UPI002118E44B|nr:probable chitinase 10 isoform X1 [Schistocerca cancellata]
MRGVFLIASCLLVSLVVFSHAATLRQRHMVLVANAGCSGAGEPFPNPDDCGSFLQCEASGVAAVKQCPANLHFNAELKVCDYPWSANCKEADSSSGDSSSQEDDDSSSEEADKAVAKVSKKLESGAPAKKPKAIALHA